MKKIIVLSAHARILDRRIIEEVNALVSGGYDVTLISIPALIPDDMLDRRVKVKIVSGAGGLSVKGGAAAKLVKWCGRIKSSLKQNILKHAWTKGIAYSLLYGLTNVPQRFYRYFIQAAIDEKGDIYHAHDLNTLAAACEAARVHKAAVIYDSHELYPYQIGNRIYRRVWRKVEGKYINKVDEVITINHSVADCFVNFYKIKKPSVIFNSYFQESRDVNSKDKIREKLGIAPDKKIIMFQGGLSEGRNLENLVKAGHLLLGLPVVLVLVGDGVLRPKLERLIRKYNVEENVRLTGWIDQKNLLSYTAAADAGIIPYADKRLLNHRYCTPNKLFEFIEAEVPVIGNDFPEIRRIVTGAGIGIVRDLSTPGGISVAIKDFLAADEKKLAEFRRNLGKAREEYGWKNQEKILQTVYERLAGKQPKSHLIDLLFLSQYYYPEVGAAPARISGFARMLKKRGHGVEVLTAVPNYPQGKIYPGYRNVFRKTYDGAITVHRTPLYISSKRSAFHRLINYATFMINSSLYGLQIKRPEVIFVTSGPLFAGLSGYFLSRVKRVPFIFDVRDVWPERIATFGGLKNKIALRILKYIEMFICRNAYHIVVVTEGLRSNLEMKGVPLQKITLITNGVDLNSFKKEPPDEEFARSLGLDPRKFNVVYAGCIGLVQHMPSIIEAARILEREKDIFFIIVGDGVKKEISIQMAEKAGLKNLKFLSALPSEQIAGLINISKVGINSNTKHEHNKMAIPVKMFDYLACKVPVVLGNEGITKDLVEKYQCGICVEPENGAQMADAILRLYRDQALREACAERGYRMVQELFSRQKLTDDLEKLLRGHIGEIRAKRLGCRLKYED